jgi:hypothetical protein
LVPLKKNVLTGNVLQYSAKWYLAPTIASLNYVKEELTLRSFSILFSSVGIR